MKIINEYQINPRIIDDVISAAANLSQYNLSANIQLNIPTRTIILKCLRDKYDLKELNAYSYKIYLIANFGKFKDWELRLKIEQKKFHDMRNLYKLARSFIQSDFDTWDEGENGFSILLEDFMNYVFYQEDKLIKVEIAEGTRNGDYIV